VSFMSLLLHTIPTSAISTLSLHDALPIFGSRMQELDPVEAAVGAAHPEAKPRLQMPGRLAADLHAVHLLATLVQPGQNERGEERSEEHTSELSHVAISYAVFCLKKKR